MKKVPESFELSQEDIEEAIAYWLNHEHGNGEYYDSAFTVAFKIEEKENYPPRSPHGGLNGPFKKTLITAVAVKDE